MDQGKGDLRSSDVKPGAVLTGVLVGVAVTPVAAVLAEMSAGAGHGNYGLARLLFPGPMFLTLLAEDTITSTDLKSHRELLAAADVVVTMTAEQKRLVAALADGHARPTLTLRELAGESGDIGDPVGQGEDTYRACRDEIARCLEKGFARLLG